MIIEGWDDAMADPELEDTTGEMAEENKDTQVLEMTDDIFEFSTPEEKMEFLLETESLENSSDSLDAESSFRQEMEEEAEMLSMPDTDEDTSEGSQGAASAENISKGLARSLEAEGLALENDINPSENDKKRMRDINELQQYKKELLEQAAKENDGYFLEEQETAENSIGQGPSRTRKRLQSV